MLFLQLHHILDLYCWVADEVPQTYTTGRPTLMNDAEMVTMLIWSTITLKQKTLRDVYTTLMLYHQNDFPAPPSYATFVRRAHAVLPDMLWLLG